MMCKFLEQFIFCPKCGGEFVDNNVKSKRCRACDFVYYFNPSAAVAAIIKNGEGDILVSVRAHEPAKGTFDLPGGFVDSFETGEQAVAREVREECNVEVARVRYLFSLPNTYLYSGFEVHTLDQFFECEVSGLDNLAAADDVESLRFIPIDKINPNDFGLNSVREAMRRYAEGRD